MSVYARKGSRWWWLWLESAPPGRKREKTAFEIGTTVAERQRSRKRAEELYHRRMLELAGDRYQMPVAPQAVLTFNAFADWYDANHIVHHAGKEREREILKTLRSTFGAYPLESITKELVIDWRTRRRAVGITAPYFGGGAKKAPALWRQIHALLLAQGPMSVAAIRAAFGGSTRGACRMFLKPDTEMYFERVSRAVWKAIGKPHAPRSHTFPVPSARTVNREVDLLQQMLSAAVEAAKLSVSPLYGLANLEIVEPIRRTMSEAEERAVLGELESGDRAILILGLDTLARMVDILDLQWADDHGSVIDIRDPKNGHSHTVPLSMRARAALDALPKEGPYIFPGRRLAATASGRRGTIRKALKRACEAAGVPYGRAARGLTFHWSTRRTGATRMIRRGGEKSVGVVQRIGNWKNPSVLIGIYQETITADMIAAVETVSSGFGSPNAPKEGETIENTE